MTLDEARTLKPGDRVRWICHGQKIVEGTVKTSTFIHSRLIAWEHDRRPHSYVLGWPDHLWWANVAREGGD